MLISLLVSASMMRQRLGLRAAYVPTNSPFHWQAEEQHNTMLDDCLGLRELMGSNADLISLGTAFKVLVEDLPKVWCGDLLGRKGRYARQAGSSPGCAMLWKEVGHGVAVDCWRSRFDVTFFSSPPSWAARGRAQGH